MIRELFRTLRVASRTFSRRPAITALIILTLALGIGANSALFSVVDTILLRPLPFKNAERLIRVETVRGSETGFASVREMRDLEERLGELFEGVAAYVPDSEYTLSGQGDAEKLPAILITHDFFEVLGVPLLHGGAWPAEFDQNRSYGILLSHRVWQKKFAGDPSVVGRAINLDASPSHSPTYTVYGVLPKGIDFPLRSDLYRSLYISPSFPNTEDRGERNVVVIARLKPGADLEAVRQRISGLSRALAAEFPETNEGVSFAAFPLRETYVGSVRPYLLLLLGAVSLVLLIACANVANLLLSAALEREREIAIRAALGAERGRLVRLLLAESVLLALAGGLLGLLFAVWGVRALPALVKLDLPAWMTFELDARALAFTFLLSLLTGTLAGLTPAFRTSKGRLPDLLREGSRGSAGLRHARLQALLVVIEVGLSLMLLIGAGLMTRTFISLWRSDVGFNPDRLLTFRIALPWTYSRQQIPAFQRDVLARLEVLPGVEEVALNNNLPFAGLSQSGRGVLATEGQSQEQQSQNPYANVQIVSPGYFQLMGIPLRAGRFLDETDRSGATNTVVVGERLARALWPGQNAVGKRVRRISSRRPDSPWYTVVGVVGDVKNASPIGEMGSDLYFSSLQVIDGSMYVLLRTQSNSGSLVEDVRRAVAAVDPNQPVYDFLSMRERLMDTVWQQRLSGTLFGLFAALALVLAATGIYGVLSYAVEQRTRETGIRMALGAEPGQLMRGVLGEALRLALLGVTAGLAGAMALVRLLRSLLYGISPFDLPTFVAVALLLVGVALAAGYLPARRAMQVDPLEALRWR